VSALEDWVRAHHVCWEIAPMRARDQGGRPGCELTLLALCGSGRGIDPARPECHQAYDRLAEVVARVVPPGQARHLEAYDAAVHLRPECGFAPEVELVAELFPDPATAASVRASLEAGLRLLGARAKTWAPARPAQPDESLE